MESRKVFEALRRCANDSISINSIDIEHLENAQSTKEYFGFKRLIAPEGIAEGLYLTLYEDKAEQMELLDMVSSLNGMFIDGIGFQEDNRAVFLIHLE